MHGNRYELWFLGIIYTSRVLVEGKSSVWLICMKYRIIILIIIIISVGQILLSDTAIPAIIIIIIILQTHHACTHTRMRTDAHACAHTHRRRRCTCYRYSFAPNHDGLLRWRQCLSLAIEINTGAGGPVSPRLWVFLVYIKKSRPN